LLAQFISSQPTLTHLARAGRMMMMTNASEAAKYA